MIMYRGTDMSLREEYDCKGELYFTVDKSMAKCYGDRLYKVSVPTKVLKTDPLWRGAYVVEAQHFRYINILRSLRRKTQ